MYKNHQQIFTHSIEHGVIIGQRWVPKVSGLGGTVRCITKKGLVVLDHTPKLVG
jgi:hypothetical protein